MPGKSVQRIQHDDTNQRRDRVLALIVESYVETAEPVGSRTISKRSDLGLSSASIRNVMADLEEQGLIKQPHTSAGRVPTDKGYRYYVDRLMKREELARKEKDWILSELKKAKTVEGLAEKVSKVISELTESAALTYIRSMKRVSFLNYFLEELVELQKHTDVLEEEPELFIEGAFRMLEKPEFQNAVQMRKLLLAFDHKYNFLQVLAQDFAAEGLHVHIGHENSKGELEDLSLVVKDCYVQGKPFGGVAAVGPTRMKYKKVMAVVDFVADSVADTVKRVKE